MEISGINVGLFILIFGLAILVLLKQISFQTLFKWLIGIGIFSLIIMPIGEAAQQQYGNKVYFIIILLFLIVFFTRFKFSRGVMQKTTGRLLADYLKYFFIITGISALIFRLFIQLKNWLAR